MAQFSVNAQRFDPYKNFKFRVKWDGRYVAGRQQGRRAQAHDRGGRAPRGRRPELAAASRPGAPSTKPITLERGVTHDTEFEKWANKVWNFGSGLGAGGVAAGLPQGRHHRGLQRGRASWRSPTRSTAAGSRSTRRCPISTPTPTRSRSRHIKLENEGWERDYDVAEPTEPSFTEPAS